MRAWRARWQEREFDHALGRWRQGSVVADAVYRVLTGRQASRHEIADMRREAAGGRPLLELAQQVRETPDGSRMTVNASGMAVRTWVRSQLEPGTTEFATPRLVFLHFMKVGGTSLSDELARWFGPERSRVHVFLDDIALLPVPVLGNLRVIAGHIPYAGLALIPGPFRTLAVLREPVARTLSHFSTLRTDHPHYHDLTLDRFVFDEGFTWSGNFQARFLAADDIDVANAWRTYSPEERLVATGGDRYTANPLQALFERADIGQTDEDLLANASANLDRIDFVGTTDDLDAAAGEVASLFGLAPVKLGRLNQSAQRVDRGDIGPHILRRIEERTAVDRELYERARKRAAVARR